MEQAITWLGTAYEADTSRVGIIGDSEGGDLALNFTWRHTDTVKVCITRLTPPDVQALYDVNGIVAATVDTAFDQLGGWAANREAHDPSSNTNIALLSDLSERIRMYYSSNDGLAPEADHLTFSAATGIRVTSVGAVDHDIQTTEAVDDESQASWIWTRLTA
jgi:acetyl esterase/lipase